MRYRCYSDLRKVLSCSPLPAPVNSLQNIANITQETAALVALVKRELRKLQENWHWRLPKEPCRNRTGRKGFRSCGRGVAFQQRVERIEEAGCEDTCRYRSCFLCLLRVPSCLQMAVSKCV